MVFICSDFQFVTLFHHSIEIFIYVDLVLKVDLCSAVASGNLYVDQTNFFLQKFPYIFNVKIRISLFFHNLTNFYYQNLTSCMLYVLIRSTSVFSMKTYVVSTNPCPAE